MGPYGAEHFKTLLLQQIIVKNFETHSEFPLNGPQKNTFGIFKIFPSPIFNDFPSFFSMIFHSFLPWQTASPSGLMYILITK